MDKAIRARLLARPSRHNPSKSERPRGGFFLVLKLWP
jgi:hypothetical protein